MLVLVAIIACFTLLPLVYSAVPPTKAYEIFTAVSGCTTLAAKVTARDSVGANSVEGTSAAGAALCSADQAGIGYFVITKAGSYQQPLALTLALFNDLDTLDGIANTYAGAKESTYYLAWRYNLQTTSGSTCSSATDTFGATGMCNCADLVRENDGPFACQLAAPVVSRRARRRALQHNRIMPGEVTQPYFK